MLNPHTLGQCTKPDTDLIQLENEIILLTPILVRNKIKWVWILQQIKIKRIGVFNSLITLVSLCKETFFPVRSALDFPGFSVFGTNYQGGIRFKVNLEVYTLTHNLDQ